MLNIIEGKKLEDDNIKSTQIILYQNTLRKLII